MSHGLHSLCRRILLVTACLTGTRTFAQYEGLVINEFLANPRNASGVYVDANQDGATNVFDDEFIELVNTSTNPIDVAGLWLTDANTNIRRHVFSARILPPGGGLVVFGGGSVLDFPHPPAQIATGGGLSLNNNEAETLSLFSPQTALVDQVSYQLTATHDAIARTRRPDGTGAFTNHYQATTNTARASPGRQIHGHSFLTNQPPVLVDLADQTAFVGLELQFPVRAYDPADGDSIQLSVAGHPAPSALVSTGGVGMFTFTPEAGQAGQTYAVSFIAADNDGAETNTVSIQVINPNANAEIWINELHYDNTGSDAEEGFEVAGTAGTVLTNYALVLYNGNNSKVYDTRILSGTLDDEQCGYGAAWFGYVPDGVQNGPNDAVALVQGTNVLQFLGYEGSLTAADGPAAGLTASDIGVEESSTTPLGDALQLHGTGTTYGAFAWASAQPHSRGVLNPGQSIACPSQAEISLQKTVYLGHDGGAGFPGLENVQGTNGAPITYLFLVANPGSAVITNVEIQDVSLGIPPITVGTLAGGASVTARVETAVAGDLRNTAVAIGFGPDGGLVQDEDTAEVVQILPRLDLQKTVYRGHDGGAACPGADEVQATNGTPITYCFTVANNGNTNLTGITLQDPDLLPDPVMVGELAAGALFSTSIAAFVSGTLTNIATATGYDPNNDPVGAADSAVVREIHPSLALRKTVYLGHDGGAACPGADEVLGTNGAAITFCLAVSNGSDVALSGIFLQDPALDPEPFPVGSLAPGEFFTTSVAAYVSGTLTNTATATGYDPNNDPVGAADSAVVREIHPSLALRKTVYLGHDGGAACPGTEEVSGTNGTPVTFCFAVSNNGDATLTAVTLSDPALPGFAATNLGTFAPGASTWVFFESVVSASRVNTARAAGLDPNGDPVETADSATVIRLADTNLCGAFTVIDLGTLGGNMSQAYGLNDRGQVVGQARDADGRDQAFLWQNGVITNLFAGAGYLGSLAWDVNQSGAVSGELTLTNGEIRAFFIAATGLIVRAPFSNGSYTYGRGLNEAGDAVGLGDIMLLDNNQPALWSRGQAINLGTFASCFGENCWFGTFPGNTGVAYDVNDATQVVGFAHNGIALQYWDPFIWFDSYPNGIRDNWEMINLGSLGGYAGYAFSINENGVVVGKSLTDGWSGWHAFRVTPSNGQWNAYGNDSRTNLWMQDLGTLGGPESSANAINDMGDIVGGADTTGSGQPHAFIYTNGRMIDLNDLICPDSGWLLTDARDINNAGQIAGIGILNGETRGFLLTSTAAAVAITRIAPAGSGSGVLIEWHGTGTDLQYVLESSDSLVSPVWTAPAPATQWPARVTAWEDNAPTGTVKQFYRVRGFPAP